MEKDVSFWGEQFLPIEKHCLDCSFFQEKCLGSVETSYCYIQTKTLTVGKKIKKQLEHSEIKQNQFLLARVYGKSLTRLDERNIRMALWVTEMQNDYPFYVKSLKGSLVKFEEAKEVSQIKVEQIRKMITEGEADE